MLTTGIFWGAEYTADALAGTPPTRNVVAALSLALGYFIKYRLVRRYVFRASP